MPDPSRDTTAPQGSAGGPEGGAVGSVVEPTPDPLTAFAVDANELISRIHAGQGEDVSSLVQRSLSERAA
ncbi:MAG: hypothetical protein DHS20C14_08550 [Phycisphaeraceae bacterium]|nr:MAG: hypothetical protein DHS20C14_08550 [Phycisphaeraceae bacterium]